MAKGFGSGLVQGAVVSAVAVAVLSLVAPQPEPVARSEETSAPTAETLAVPAGSEFGRGTDEAPQMPEPLTRPGTQVLGDAPAAMAPASDPVPTPTTTTAARPETRDIEPEAPRAISPVDEPGELPEAPSVEARVPATAPGRVMMPARDTKPAQLNADSDVSPAAGTAQGRQADVGPEASAGVAPAAEDQPARTAAPAAPQATAPETAPSTVGARGEAEPEKPAAQIPPTTGSHPPESAPHRPSVPAETVQSPQKPMPARPFPGLDLSTPPDLGGLNLSN